MTNNKEASNAVSLSWTNDLPFGLGFLLKSLVPPMIVLIVNNILLKLIAVIG